MRDRLFLAAQGTACAGGPVREVPGCREHGWGKAGEGRDSAAQRQHFRAHLHSAGKTAKWGFYWGGGITRLTASTVEWELIMPPTPHIHHWRPPPFLGLCTRQGTSQGGPSTLLSRWPDAWQGHRPSLKSCLLKAFQAGRLLGDHVTGGSQT